MKPHGKLQTPLESQRAGVVRESFLLLLGRLDELGMMSLELMMFLIQSSITSVESMALAYDRKAYMREYGVTDANMLF